MCYYMGFKTSKDQMIRAKQIEKEFGVDEALKWVRSIVSGFEYGNWPVLKPKQGVARIKEIAAYQFPAAKMHGYTVAKDVRNAYDPIEAVEYPELEPLQLC